MWRGKGVVLLRVLGKHPPITFFFNITCKLFALQEGLVGARDKNHPWKE